ncbi:hypothetical protein L798_14524 [Zootermopsis nevadensis]|uniref:Uncharacterized protein n=1 Tax=Zootermopsis nevadensis TaxID=136037 RepID=A0A067QNY0_ZOONE|nr:hypothetical protein L798_14524 [Zootermopsis nevadensis]
MFVNFVDVRIRQCASYQDGQTTYRKYQVEYEQKVFNCRNSTSHDKAQS